MCLKVAKKVYPPPGKTWISTMTKDFSRHSQTVFFAVRLRFFWPGNPRPDLRMFWIQWMAVTRWRRWVYHGSTSVPPPGTPGFTLKLRDLRDSRNWTMGRHGTSCGDLGSGVSDFSGGSSFQDSKCLWIPHQNQSKPANPSARRSCVAGWCQVFRAVFETWECEISCIRLGKNPPAHKKKSGT